MGRVLPEDAELAAAAKLRHALGFDELALPSPSMGYESRSSCQCTRACAAIWVGAKSGAVMRLELTGGKPTQRWFPGDREARSVCHVHDGLARGGGSVLLIGRDDGCLEIVPDRHPAWTQRMPAQRSAPSIGRIHLDAWWASRGERPVVTSRDVVECDLDAPAKYAMGVTAIAALPRPGAPHTLDLLVATRHPWLHVIEARADTLRLINRVSLPGWIDWIFAPRYPGGLITCLSRGGDLVRFTHEALLRGELQTRTSLSILPTAAIWLGATTRPAPCDATRREDDTGLLVGTTTGLFVLRDAPDNQVVLQAVPVTRAGVLSLGAADVSDSDGAHRYVTLGLDDGRLRVVAIELIHGQAPDVRSLGTTQSFSIELGAAVLATQTLQPEGCPPERAYVLAVLRDHSIRVYQVTSERTQRDLVTRRWDAYLQRLASASAGAADFELELKVASSAPPSRIDPASWTFVVVDVVLPRVCARAAELPLSARPAMYERITRLACALVASADRQALQRLSVSLHALAGGDLRQAQRISASILRAAVARSETTADATEFIASHLRDLNLLAGACADTDRPLLVFWTRFVRKYLVRGPVFAAKRLRLIELVEQNYRARKHLDALIYQARLHRRGYDLRWETRLDTKVAAVHVAQCAGRAIVVVVTADGRLVVLDRGTGDRLAIANAGHRADEFAPFERHGEVRTLASAVIEDGGLTRVVLSGEGARLRSPGLAVIDLSADPDDPGGVAVASAAHPTCEAQTWVYAVQPLPGRTDTFVVGLDTRQHPVGRLHHGWSWVLERAVRDGAADGLDDEGPQRAPGRVPTRAVAVVEADARGAQFLAVTGSDDGQVLGFRLAGEDHAADWRLTVGIRVTDPIRCVALGRHESAPAADHPNVRDDTLFTCYLGTTAGDTLAFSIGTTPERVGETPRRFGPYFAQALWRETHDAPVLAARLWRSRAFTDRVLVLVTESGRLCLYRVGMRSNQVSAQNNYYFRGLRLDRIALPDRVSALALAEGEQELVAATPDGHVCLARLVYLRGSEERHDPEQRPPGGPGGTRAPVGAGESPPLPEESWARMHHLFAASEIDEPFAPLPDQRAACKLELCELIRLDHGVLSAYALRERLTFHEPWDQLDADQIRVKARELLRGLHPDSREHAERMKVILKSLCGAFLSRHPDRLRDELLAQPQLAPGQRAAIVAVCDLVHEEILTHLTQATQPGARVAIVAMKELLRVPVLRAMASADEHGPAVCNAVGAALAACLRHDDRLVRTEALRAASVMLRNVGIMLQARPDARARLLAALFPDGLASLAWLLDPIIDGLLRSPGFNARTVLVSGAWYRVSAITQLFWIFPDRTLTLCDHLIGRGLPVDVLALCVQTMRGNRVKETKGRIVRWFLLPSVDPNRHRDSFIDQYQLRDRPPPQPAPSAPWHEIDDVTMAGRLDGLLDQLARMWACKELGQLRGQGSPSPRPQTSPGVSEPPLAALGRVVAQLATIAHDLADANRQDAALNSLASLRSADSVGRVRLTRPIQTIVSAIAEHWTDLCKPRLPESGDTVGRFVLGRRLAGGGFGEVFEIEAPPQDRGTHVIKVLRVFTHEARDQFVEGARVNQELSTEPHVAKVRELVEPGSSRPAYVMPRYGHALGHYLTPGLRAQTREWAVTAARHLGEALRAAHRRAYCHGDVKPSNILVNYDRQIRQSSFFLADFDLSRAPDDSSLALHGIVPSCLLRKCQADDSLQIRQWVDLAALSLIVYRMLSGEEIRNDAKNLQSCRGPLEQLLIEHRADPASQGTTQLIATLQHVLDLETEAIDVDRFLSWLAEGPRQLERPALPNRPLRVLFLAANPTGTTHLQQLDIELRAVSDRLSGRSDIALTTGGSVRIEDLVTPLGRIRPDVVHFGGHGVPEGIIVHGDGDQPRLVTGEALARCLDGRGVTLVVLSSCHSKHQADAILPMVRAVVGTTASVADEAARLFSTMLYSQIAAGLTLGEAFKDARDLVVLHGSAFKDARDLVGLHGLPDVFHAAGDLDLVLVPRR